MTEDESRFSKAATIFLAVIGLAILANAASYFLLSDGYGVAKGNDQIIRFGFPFLVYEKGGFAFRDRFYWPAAAKNVAVAIAFASAITCVWYVSTRAGSASPEE
jgi:hypothetical protein